MVVAIIAVLAALLLPALRNAKEASKTAFCINNLRQVHLACMSYAQDSDGWLIVYDFYNSAVDPPHPPGWTMYWWTEKYLGGYIWPNKSFGNNLGKCPVTVCPSMSTADKTRPAGDQQYFNLAGSYNPNGYFSCYVNGDRHGIATLEPRTGWMPIAS